MAAIPVTSSEHPVNPPRPHVVDEITNNSRRLKELEWGALAALEARIAALEAAVFP